MRILVTGGAGFIGSHVAEHLIDRGHEVAIMDNLSSGKRENVPNGATLHVNDIRHGCAEVFRSFRPEAVSHHAAQMDVRRSVCEPEFDADVNVIGTIQCLRHCVDHGTKKVVFASIGGAIYGDQRDYPAAEGHPQYPVSPYGVSKLAAERYLHFYSVQHGLRYAALRYANVYGPRQDPHGEAGVVAIFCGNLASGKPSMIKGSGEQTRDYVYVGDVARANVKALEEEVPSGAYNIGTATETSVKNLYEILAKISGTGLSPKYGPGKSGEQLRSSIDATLAERVLGWRAETSLDAGLAETLSSFRRS